MLFAHPMQQNHETETGEHRGENRKTVIDIVFIKRK